MSVSTNLFRLSVLVVSFAFVSCSDNKKNEASEMPEKKRQLIARIDSLEGAMRGNPMAMGEEKYIETGMYLADAYQRYSVFYVSDSITPEYVFRLGQVYENVLKDAGVAAEYYHQAYRRHKNYARRDAVLFALANLYHNAGINDRAKLVLEQLLEEYPNTYLKQEALALKTIVAQDSTLKGTVERFKTQNN